MDPVITESKKRRWLGYCAFFLELSWETSRHENKQYPEYQALPMYMESSRKGIFSPVFRKERGKGYTGVGRWGFPALARLRGKHMCMLPALLLKREETRFEGMAMQEVVQGLGTWAWPVMWSAFKSGINCVYFPFQRCFMFSLGTSPIDRLLEK